MNDVEQRVLECFGAVFPDVAPAEMSQLHRDAVAEWDSITQVTIIAALGEAFATEFDFEEFFEASSFDDVVDRVRAHLAAKAS
jgi:acyl carrier protein